MAWQKKFQKQLELTKVDLLIPDKACIVYAVCGCEKDSCGWEGWMIECVSKNTDPNVTQLKCMDEQICPECGKDLFRTDTQVIMKYSNDQSGLLIEGVDYESDPMEFE